MVAAGLVGLGLAVTPGLGGHAGTGIQTGLAIPADMVHVAAMACWLGGLVLLCVAVLPKGDADELRIVLPRYSALALGAIVALVVSGGYQAWRQVGSIDALKSTDYGRLLIAKLVVFAALIVAAAFSREIVNRRFRGLPPDDEDITADETVLEPVPVAVGMSSSGGGAAGSVPEPQGRFDDDGYDGGWDDDTTDEEEVRRLRRSVAVEVLIAAIILADHRAARERGAGPLDRDAARVADAEVEAGVGVRRHRARHRRTQRHALHLAADRRRPGDDRRHDGAADATG